MTCRNIRSLCFAICVGAALSGCETPTIYQAAPTQDAATVAQRPSFTPGDEFWFHVGGTAILVEEFLGAPNGLLAFRRALQNETLFYSPDLSLVRVERAFDEDEFIEPDNAELDFPLSVGKTWTRTYRLRSESSVYTGRRTRSCEVLDTGQVSSQAGEFLAFRIACTVREVGDAFQTQEEVLYAPAVGRIVNRRTLGGGTELNLIEYTRAK